MTALRKPDERLYEAEYVHEPEDDDDAEEERFLVEYTVSRIIPARGPSLTHPGCPSEGGEVTILSISPNPPYQELRERIARWIEDYHDYSEDY